ncbi:inhibitor of nuclear factor kappa-b kinase subunit alpha [Anaeramoeba flamelloides]|uniref:Inhibitor of nuclear factor kappa-b kinase subunit alpha n=1 Tax=Anaeramoeba flamelloides TaxID=1746091 RepID=A0AAV7ZEH1_9EUKA|nr:inhibitor of nuclear factor kappa-b kinase subunit alpha [Anaeramoeba flamelloides]
MIFFRKKNSKKNKNIKKNFERIDVNRSNPNFLFDTPKTDTKIKRKKKKKQLTQLIESINKDSKTLNQIINLQIGNEEDLVEDFLFQDYEKKIRSYRTQFRSLIQYDGVTKKHKLEVEQTKQQLKDIIAYIDKCIQVGQEKQRQQMKEKKIKKQTLGVVKKKKRRYTICNSPKEKIQPKLDLLELPKSQKHEDLDQFDEFFTKRQRRYSGSRMLKH